MSVKADLSDTQVKRHSNEEAREIDATLKSSRIKALHLTKSQKAEHPGGTQAIAPLHGIRKINTTGGTKPERTFKTPTPLRRTPLQDTQGAGGQRRRRGRVARRQAGRVISREFPLKSRDVKRMGGLEDLGKCSREPRPDNVCRTLRLTASF
ncbi:hypothetical protein O3P69_004454 [Scylla paramamosain]|uniref:Uncharacterized protein n=1 Tax=Scylla paramamosain TaxID=85552 RepID=A0AAW0UDK5_SCYPA